MVGRKEQNSYLLSLPFFPSVSYLILYGFRVVLKKINDSSNISEDFLNEWKLHLQCHHKTISKGSIHVPLFEITQDPETLNYMAVVFKFPFAQDELSDKIIITMIMKTL
ncbi:kinase-like domain-containing protein [Rhizophagus irregularis DAOM 181602=DAOM 197198]|nr:kinase-like domain-containing protein [Rhizophagus irregularis DAOM 181602=DAOM 197198]